MPKNISKAPASRLKRGIIISAVALFLILASVYCVLAVHRTGTVYPTQELIDGLPTIHFVDVGQGDCTLVTYRGDSILVDAGTLTSGRIAAEYVRVRAPVVDYFIITHPHEDHMGGAPFVFDAVRVKNLVIPTDVVADEFYSQTLEKARKQGTNIIYITSESEFSVGDINFTILDTFDEAQDDLNNSSLMVRVDVLSTSLLITGDAEEAEEAYAIAHNEPCLLDCDILKVGHHGSSTSTTEDFLRSVSPEICVVSCGRNNSYGHPSTNVETLIEVYGAILHRTDKEGSVVIRCEKQPSNS